MTNIVLRFAAFAAVVIALCFVLGLFDVSLSPIVLLIVAAIAAVVAWPLLTWYFADDEPLFGPTSHRRVTFKQVLQGVLRDVRDLLKLDVAAKWVLTNATALAVFLSGLVSMADPMLRQAILDASWNGVPVGALSLLAVTWLATVKRA